MPWIQRSVNTYTFNVSVIPVMGLSFVDDPVTKTGVGAYRMIIDLPFACHLSIIAVGEIEYFYCNTPIMVIIDQ